MSERNQFTIRIFRAFNYSLIIDSNVNNIVDQFDFNNQINNQFVNVNQFIDTNSTTTRETSIEKTIYSTLIESTMTKTVDSVVQTTIDVSMNIMFIKIEKMITSQTRQSKQIDFNDFVDSSDSSELSDDNDNDNDTFRWQSIDFEFFDSYYEDKFFVIVSSMTHFDKDVIFRNVHVFVNRVKKLITIKKTKLIRNNLSTCLRKQTLIWHIFELTDAKRRLLKYDDEIDEWKLIFVKKFRESSTRVMKTFTSTHFNMNDVRQMKKSKKYAQTIIRVDKSVELSIYNQMFQIWNELDINFKLHVQRSTSTINLNDFLRDLKERKNFWWKLIENRVAHEQSRQFDRQIDQRKDDNQSQREENQQRDTSNVNYNNRNREQQVDEYISTNNAFRFEFQSTYVSIQFQNFISSNQWYQKSVYQNQQQFVDQFSNASSQQSILSVSFDRKIITIEQFDQQNQDSKDQSNASDFKRQLLLQYDSNRQQTFLLTYHAIDESKNNRFSSSNMLWMSTIEYYENETTEYYEDDEYKNDNDIVSEFALVTKSNFAVMKSENDFVAIHFVISSTVSYVCRKCYLNFSFNNKLHRHVRECRKQLQFVDTSSSSAHVLSIVKSTTILSKQIDYVFRF